jgi:SAM-dependent methyltransferase
VSDTTIKQIVQEKYGQVASRVAETQKEDCCKPTCCGEGGTDVITRHLYTDDEQLLLPKGAVAASLGCGNPTALATLEAGDTVLDLGSGGGIDVLLSARRVGPTGKAFGLDLTDEMLALARENQRQAGLTNVEFLKGQIEEIPLPEDSVDIIISNCVINLSADKPKVLAEAFRVLKPGGRFAVSDIVRRRAVPDSIRQSLELWAGCVAGALSDTEYRDGLRDVGFTAVDIEPTRIYRAEDAAAMVGQVAGTSDLNKLGQSIDGAYMSAFIRARKPQAI